MIRSFSRALGGLRPLGYTLCAAVIVTAGACSSNASGKSADTTSSADATVTPRNFALTADQRARIHLVTVQTTSFYPTVDVTGNVSFNQDRSTQVLSPVSGPAVRVVGELGETVSRGTPLAYVTSPDFASAVGDYRKAQATYRNASIVAKRDSALFANDALARADLEQAQTGLASAEADVESSVQAMRSLGVEEQQIDAIRQGKATTIEAIIRSPIDGTVVEKLISPGQLLQAGTTPTFTVADLSTMWVLTNAYAADMRDVAVGEQANVITDASRAPVPGRVDYVASVVDPGTKAVTVRVLASNPGGVLRRDMFVHVQIKSAMQHQGILVPTSSVMRDEENLPFVFVVAPGNTYQRRRVDLGSRVGDQYEVVGLKPGDQVVAEGALFLQFAETQ